MTVADIERIGAPQITRQVARQAFLDYRRAVLGETDLQRKAEYDGLMRGYKAIAAGKQVIDLAQTMSTAGVQDDTLYPRLAICRADAKKCSLRMDGNGSAVFSDAAATWRATSRRVSLPVATFPRYAREWKNGRTLRYRPGGTLERENWSDTATAVVPLVPANLHPKAALSNYHIIWDAVWTPEPPSDPLLVKHLAGHLYAIVAHWDLSPLERAVLRGRL